MQVWPAANKATLTQYGVIILDLLLKADLLKFTVYKPRGRGRSAGQPKPKANNTAVCYEISASNMIGHGMQRENHNMLEKEREKDTNRH